MKSGRFHQAGKKKCQVGKEEMQAEWCRKRCRRSGISLWHSENLVRIAKISQS